MNGAADMGGMHGFGPVQVEADEPVFHADWEKKAFALNIAIGVANIWNLDEFRFARESLPPPQYLNMSYYGLWVATLALPALGAVVGDQLGNAVVSVGLQLGKPTGDLFTDGGSAFAVLGALLAVPVAAAARFLGYIDLRTRKEGWDIQLRFMALVAESSTGRRSAA